MTKLVMVSLAGVLLSMQSLLCHCRFTQPLPPPYAPRMQTLEEEQRRVDDHILMRELDVVSCNEICRALCKLSHFSHSLHAYPSWRW